MSRHIVFFYPRPFFQDFIGRIRLFGGPENAINDKNEIIYKLTYPDQSRLPTITEIRINKEIICSGPKSSKYGALIQLQHKLRAATSSNFPDFNPPPIYQPITTTTSKPREIPTPPRRTTTTTKSPRTLDRQQLIENICGRVGPIPLFYIIGGQTISQGSWPWLVAMYDKDGFRCGASLITSKAILTSAHCLGTQRSHISPDLLTIAVGKHNISDLYEESHQILQVDQIFIHPDFKNNNNYDADIALILVKGRVT